MKRIALVCMIFAFVSTNGQGQNVSARLHAAIDEVSSALRSLNFAGGRFDIDDFVSFDSIECLACFDVHSIESNRSTLQGCYVFIVQGLDSSGQGALQKSVDGTDSLDVLGVYKDGVIRWMSEPINGNYVAGKIFAISDINGDGKAEILVDWSYGFQGQSSELWIFAWDGQRGEPINSTTESGASVIKGAYVLRDLNGDGIQEILGTVSDPNNETDVIQVVYSWNGSKYGAWTGAPQPSAQMFTVANNLSANVKAEVRVAGANRVMFYTLANDPGSKQSIKYFFLPDEIDTMTGTTPPGWVVGRMRKGTFIDCLTTSDQYNVLPGSSQANLGFISHGLPKIMTYHIQGPTSPIQFSGVPGLQFSQQVLENVRSNSVSGLTIGPTTPPLTLVPLNFLDTIAGYVAQSGLSGWIKFQSTTNKYLAYFSSAKSSLQQSNVSSTRTTLQQVLQDVNVDSTSNLTSEAYALIRFNTEYLLGQLPNIPPPPAPGLNVKLINSTGTKLTGGVLQYYDGSWKDATNNTDGTFSITTSLKTLSLRMTYEFATQTKSNVTVGYDTVAFQTVNTRVKLQNSQGAPIDTGTVQYYFSSWKPLGTTTNGVASKELLRGNYTFRMTYASATNDKQQDIGANPIVIFQTVNTAVQLKNSQGTLMDQGTVQYYFSSWKSFGSTTGGVATKELLPGNYTFRMSYAAATNDKQQNIGTNATVVFQTVNAAVQLKNSLGSFIDQGTVQYYFSSWNNFGSTSSGVATKELLPGNYTFRMTYASATNDKQQNIGTNPTVLFQTVNATVQLQNSLGSPIDQGTVQYYFSSWNNFGSTSGGVATKELLPGNYTFRMTYAAATNDKQQNIGTNPVVLFQTVNATVRLQNSLGSPIDQGTVQYYFSSWNNLGATTNGVAAKELLPGNYTFRMTYEAATNDKQQNIGSNPAVAFQTVNAIVQLRNSLGAPIDTGRVQYYFSSWRDLGTTSDGVAAKELLPANYTFRMTHESVTNDKAQNISTNGTVTFSTVLCTVSVKNGQNEPVENAMISFYFNAWRQIGPTVNGQVTKELLPANLTFRMTVGTATQNKTQNIGTNGLVEFTVQ